MSDTQPRVLDDLFVIPDEVRANAFVVNMSEVDDSALERLINDYVVTDQLRAQFDRALGLVRDSLKAGRSEASYVDGSFGAGKSHFLAVFGALLNGHPQARRKLGDLALNHDEWLGSKKFLQVKLNLVNSESLASAVFKGYIETIQDAHPNAPFPALLRDEGLLRNGRELRQILGDEQFAAKLVTSDEEDEDEDDWGESGWTTEKLDRAFNAPHGDPERSDLVASLLSGLLSSYSDTVSGIKTAYVAFEEGLSLMSVHARDLGYDGIVLLLDELVLWLSAMLGETTRINHEAQSVSRLVESEDKPRPIPIISFVPRQRDLQELVGRDITGAETQTLFETLDHWKGRFNTIALDDQNLPEVVRHRMLTRKSEAADKAIAAAFKVVKAEDTQVRDVLLDGMGTPSTMEEFERSYPFSPVFLHAIVDIAEALQRKRSGIKLLSMLLRDHRFTLPVGQLMPVGAIFTKLIDGKDEPIGSKLANEFNNVRRFYLNRVRPWLLHRHNLTEAKASEQAANSPFAGDDLIIKTLLLSALTPGVPALASPTVSQLLALNHGAIEAFLPGMDLNQALDMLRDLGAEFGEFQVGEGDNPRVSVHLIGVDVNAIINKARSHNNEGTQTQLVYRLLWEEFGLKDSGERFTAHKFTWRGTDRFVEAQFANVRTESQPSFFPSEPDRIRMLIDFPFDERERYPSDDETRIRNVRDALENPKPLTVAWLPRFLTDTEMDVLRELDVIDYLLRRSERLDEAAANLTSDERQQAKVQLESRHKALRSKLIDSLKSAYGLTSAKDTEVAAPRKHLHDLRDSLERDKPPAGSTFKAAFEWIVKHLLDSTFPKHPNLDPANSGAVVSKRDLKWTLEAVEAAKLEEGGLLELERSRVATIKRIANPLEFGTVRENLVLNDAMRYEISRRLGLKADDDTTVTKVRNTIDDMHPGLPLAIRDLMVRVYAIQDDRAWRRAGQLIEPPGIDDRLAGEMELVTRELPTQEEFERAAERAHGIFETSKRQVRVFRQVQGLAGEINAKVEMTSAALSMVLKEFGDHADVLGLTPDSKRWETAAQLDRLYANLNGDPTQVLQVLASADLPKAYADYRGCVRSILGLAKQLKERTDWRVLERLNDGTPEMSALRDELTKAAREDEVAVALAGAISKIQDKALSIITAAKPVVTPVPIEIPAPESAVETPAPQASAGTAPGSGQRVRAAEAAGHLAKLERIVSAKGGEWELDIRNTDDGRLEVTLRQLD